MSRECRMHDLLGRRLIGGNNRAIGRIEEFRAERRGAGWMSTGVYVGFAGLLERLDVGWKSLFGGKRHSYFVRWDQIDVSDPKKPRLTCPLSEVERI